MKDGFCEWATFARFCSWETVILLAIPGLKFSRISDYETRLFVGLLYISSRACSWQALASSNFIDCISNVTANRNYFHSRQYLTRTVLISLSHTYPFFFFSFYLFVFLLLELRSVASRRMHNRSNSENLSRFFSWTDRDTVDNRDRYDWTFRLSNRSAAIKRLARHKRLASLHHALQICRTQYWYDDAYDFLSEHTTSEVRLLPSAECRRQDVWKLPTEGSVNQSSSRVRNMAIKQLILWR